VSEIILGCDLSLTSPAVVALRREGGEATLDGIYCAAHRVSDVKAHGAWRFVPEPKKLPTKREEYRLQRVRFLLSRLISVVQKHQPSHVAIEDYAMMGKGAGFYPAELIGAFKLWLFQNNTPLRLYDPQAIKMFATGRGNADKDDMKAAVNERWSIGVESFGKAASDVADAAAIAHLLNMELLAREDPSCVPEMPDSLRRVLNRCTKSNPTNLLSRPFVLQHAEG